MIKCLGGGCPLDKEICCHTCDNLEDCKAKGFNCTADPKTCGDAEFEEGSTDLQAFQNGQVTVLKQIANIVTQKRSLEVQEKELKQKLQEAMELHGVKKFESDVLNITYIAATTSTSVDSKKLKQKYPEIASECSKVSDKKAYVKVAVK